MSNLANGPWLLSDLKSGKIGAPKNGLNVFSLFSCGGGSTMGYKLAGYNVIGCVEIDPKIFEIYKINHEPKYPFLMGVRDFNKLPINNHPKELFNLDILDGSPPCSSFSMAGAREKKWGKASKFREGQSVQILDDLFFHFIKTAEILKPKVIIAENVKGLIQGNAKGYVKEIFKGFNEIGYDTQLFLLNSSRMGVPQKRERTFFIARRKDLGFSKIKLEFNENPIGVLDCFSGLSLEGYKITDQQKIWWDRTNPGDSFSKNHPKKHWFQAIKLDKNMPAPTLSASDGNAGFYLWDKPKRTSNEMLIRIQTFPDDFDFLKQKVQYICGMSVPPFMMQRVALRLAEHFFKK